MEMPKGMLVLNSDTQRIVSQNYTSQVFYALELIKEMAEDLEFMEKKYGHQPMSALKKFKEWK